MLRMDFTKVRTTCALPAKRLAKLRSAGPVVEVCFPIIGKAWTITTSELAGCILKDNVTFTMRKDGDVAEFRWWMPGWICTLAASMLTMDEPDHTRRRRSPTKPSRWRAIVEMQPRILAIAHELAADLFADRGLADLVERYARKPPLSVICELLGLPRIDRLRFVA